MTARLENGYLQQHLRHVPGSFTGQAFITADLDDNQITAFHPGAMGMSHLNHVSDAKDVSIGIVTGWTRRHDSARRGICCRQDPVRIRSGPGMPMFSGEDLSAIQQADYVTVNDYEAKLLQDKAGMTLSQIAKSVRALIVTLETAMAR
jgi:adenosine kinase